MLATVGPLGPAVIPVSAVWRTGPSGLLLALATRRGSLARLRKDPRVALSLSGPGLCMSVEGAAVVAADPLPGAENMVAVAVRATSARDVRGPATEVDGGIRWRWTTEDAAARHGVVMAALARLAEQPIV